MDKQNWINYGDKNFWELGRMVKLDELDKNGEIFNILWSQDAPAPASDEIETPVIVARVYVDITDDWIDKEAVLSYGGMTESELNTIEGRASYACDCISYYGIHEFQPVFPNGVMGGTVFDWVVDKKDAIEFLNGNGFQITE